MKKVFGFCFLLGMLLLATEIYAQSSKHLSLFEKKMNLLATQLVKNTVIPLKGTIVVGVIQDLNNLNKTNDLGRLISECLIHELQIKGFKIKDIRMLSEVVVKPRKGEFVLSRNPAKLKREVSGNYILTGTYAQADDGIVINIRLMDFQTLEVVSTAQTLIPMETVADLLGNSESLPNTTIKIVGENE